MRLDAGGDRARGKVEAAPAEDELDNIDEKRAAKAQRTLQRDLDYLGGRHVSLRTIVNKIQEILAAGTSFSANVAQETAGLAKRMCDC